MQLHVNELLLTENQIGTVCLGTTLVRKFDSKQPISEAAKNARITRSAASSTGDNSNENCYQSST